MNDQSYLDPALFDPASIDPETADFNRRLEELLAATPPLQTLPPQAIRDAREQGRGTFGPVVLSDMAQKRSVPGPAGEVGLRVFLPDRVGAVYLHIHGGGYMLGRAHHSDERNEAIARHCGVAVVSVDYRLAPENPYPAGPDDCEAAALWLVKNAQAEFGTQRLIIGGESAGANLSVGALLRLRDRHDFTGFRGANLVYGGYDLGGSPSAQRWGERYLILSTPIIAWFHDNYIAREQARSPGASPLYADLSRLPPALFTVGTLDPLIDDSLFMYSRWVAAGNRAELAIYPGGVHAFDAFPTALAARARARMDTFIHQLAEAGAGAGSTGRIS